MKKRLCFVLCFVLLFTASFSFNAFADDMADIEKTQLRDSTTYYEYDASAKTLTISGTGAMPDLKNSASYQPWYDWRSDGSIEKVVIGEGITAIGEYTFYSVKASSFTLPSTLKSIGRYAFYSTGAVNIALPFGLTTVGNYAFDECVSLQSVTIPDTVTSIGNYAFRLCNSLKSVTVPYSVTSIGTYAFDRCKALENVVFEALTGTISIGNYAFYDCSALSEITFPGGATVGKQSYGFGRSGAISGAKMNVYNSSSAYIYAVTNGISYTVLDGSYPLSLGVPETVEFDANTYDKVYTFTLTPDFTGVYNFYSRGDIDVKAALYSSSELLAQSDDILSSDRNFCISYQLTEGTAYTFEVNTMGAEGSSSVVIYPDVISSFDIDGSLSFKASDGFRITTEPEFPIVDSVISDFVLDIHFENGYSDKMYYRSGYFNAKTIGIYDTQTTERFTCGENAEKIRIGDVISTFPVYVTHEYTHTVIPYTLYEDGYTVYTCILCGDEYVGDIVDTPAITVSGRCFLATDMDGGYNYEIPLTDATVKFCGEKYAVDDTGRFSFRTLDSGTLTIEHPYADDIVYTIDNQKRDINFGAIPIPAYDFNRDGYINGRDLAYFMTTYRDKLGSNYFRYAINFM